MHLNHEQQIAVHLLPVTKSDEVFKCTERSLISARPAPMTAITFPLTAPDHMTCEVPLTGCSLTVNL